MSTPKTPRLTASDIAAVAGHVRRGLSVERACVLAGLPPKAVAEVLARGRAGSGGAARELAEAVARAEAEWEGEVLSLLTAAARGGEVAASEVKETYKDGELAQRVEAVKRAGAQWQAAAWLLERCWPGQWGRERREAGVSAEDQAQEILDAMKRMQDSVPFDPEMD